MRKVINNDFYNISDRLRSIDRRYFLVWNTDCSRYEVHYEGGGNTLLLTLPYDRLDKRTIDYLYKSSIHNVDFDTIDRENDLREAKESEELNYQSKFRVKEMISFGDKIGRDYDFDSHHTRWI